MQAVIDYRSLYPKGTDSGNRRRTVCWHHDDKEPSLDIDLVSGVYKCRACGAAGNARRYITEVLGKDPKDFGLSDHISEAEVERYHAALLANPEALAYLRQRRSVKLKTLKDWKIGYDGQTSRIVFPIRDEQGGVANLRRYLPNAKGGSPKTISVKGRGGNYLHPHAILKRQDTIVIVAGETDWLVATDRGLPAVTCTGGESYWNKKWNELFRGKDVNIVYDVDDEGRRGARRVAKALHGIARRVRIIDLERGGVDTESHPKGDLSDYFLTLTPKPTVRDFNNLCQATAIFKVETTDDDTRDPLADEEVYGVDFPSAVLAQYTNRRVKFGAHVQGMDKVPYIVPLKVGMACEENQGKMCNRCACAGKGGSFDVEFDRADPRLLSMFRCSEMQQKGILRDAFGIPVRCPSYSLTTVQHANIEELHLVREIGTVLQLDDGEDKHATRLGYYVYPEGEGGVAWNASYEFESRTAPEPTRQYAVSQIYKATPKEDDLARFELSKEDLRDLKKRFNPPKWDVKGVEDVMQSRADFVSRTTSHIYGRPDMHIAVELVYNSVLNFMWEGKVTRGWLDVLLLGDTRQGKTETATAYQRLYQLGDRVDCSRATVAGLIGGAHELVKGRWTINWGALPLGDRFLVMLEEVKCLAVEQVAALKECRSSGIAEVTAIRRDRTHSRTRLIWLSNPRSTRKMETYSYGVDAARELVGSPEDIARFDYICTCADTTSEVPSAILHKLRKRSTGDDEGTERTRLAMRGLVLFAWSRGADQVELRDSTLSLIVENGRRMSDRYDDEFPLVQASDYRFKLTRVATAAAVSTCSVDRTGHRVLVRGCHVEWAAKYLRSLYNKPSLGYHRYSADQQRSKSLDNKAEIIAAIQGVPFQDTLRDSLLRTRSFNRTSVAHWAGFERDDSAVLISTLERNRAIESIDVSRYVKTPAFINLLRELQDVEADKRTVD